RIGGGWGESHETLGGRHLLETLLHLFADRFARASPHIASDTFLTVRDATRRMVTDLTRRRAAVRIAPTEGEVEACSVGLPASRSSHHCSPPAAALPAADPPPPTAAAHSPPVCPQQ